MWYPSYSPCQQKWWTLPHPWSLSLLRTPFHTWSWYYHLLSILPVTIQVTSVCLTWRCYRKREHFRCQSFIHPYPTSLSFFAVSLCGSASHYFLLCSWWTPDKTPTRARGGKNVISNSERGYIWNFPRGDSWGEETKSGALAPLKNTPSCCRLSKSRYPSFSCHIPHTCMFS